MHHARPMICSLVCVLASLGCGDDESSPDPSSLGSGGADSSGTGATGNASGDCGEATDRSKCLACCNQQHPQGSAIISEGFATECLCAATSPCNTECEDDVLCGGSLQQSQDCIGCAAQLTDDTACATRVAEECWADSSCAPIMECFGDCPM